MFLLVGGITRRRRGAVIIECAKPHGSEFRLFLCGYCHGRRRRKVNGKRAYDLLPETTALKTRLATHEYEQGPTPHDDVPGCKLTLAVLARFACAFQGPLAPLGRR